MKYIVVLITASSEKEAEKIANGLIDSKAAACVNIVPEIRSVFTWEGKKDTSRESLLIVKTSQGRFKRLRQLVKRLHSYETPEIIAVPVIAGDERYLNWIRGALK